MVGLGLILAKQEGSFAHHRVSGPMGNGWMKALTVRGKAGRMAEARKRGGPDEQV
jgi:hypothetical protein